MTAPWAVCLPAARIDALGRMRLTPEVRVCEVGDNIWLKGETLEDALQTALARLPEARQYSVLPDGQLILQHQRVPCGYLPQGDWELLSEWLQVEMPVAALAGEMPARLPLGVVRGGNPTEANVLLVTAAAWQAYAAGAPHMRLQGLSFAMNERGQTAIWGSPLPPVPGKRFAENHGVAIEAGFCLKGNIDPEIAAQVLELTSGDLALLAGDGTLEVISTEHFVQATRSAVRLSVGALIGEGDSYSEGASHGPTP